MGIVRLGVLVSGAVFLLGCSCGASHVRDDAGAPLDAPDGGRDAPDGGPDVPTCVDDDGDGLSNEAERWAGLPDVDGDGIPHELDLDSDGDGVSDHDESRDGLGVCREPIFCGCYPRFLTPDSDADGRGDAAEVAGATDPCNADEDGDSCPDGEVACGAMLAAGVWSGCTPFALSVGFDVPAVPLRTRAFVELTVTPDVLAGDRFVVSATTSMPMVGGVSGARFLDVPPGARLDFTLAAETGYHRDGPIRESATLRLLDDTGAVLEERPFLVVVPDCCPILI